MATKIKHKRSAVAGKAPQPADLDYGEIAVNYEASDPALYVKDSANVIRKIGTQPDATETVKGIVQLATAAETTTGTDATKAVHPAGLKVELDKKAPLASPALTGTPTAPTAAAGTNTTQIATTAFVTDAVAKENLWDRTGTVVSPANAGDQVHTATGKLTVGGTAAAPNLEVKADGGIVANTDGLVYDAATKRLGIGTNPLAKFHVNLGTNENIHFATAGSGDQRIQAFNDAGGTSVQLSVQASPLLFRGAGGAEVGRWDSSGRLLVGTSSDSGGALLQVNGDRIRVGTAKTPASATATGTTGEICWDASYVYVCTATNTWKRSALSTW